MNAMQEQLLSLLSHVLFDTPTAVTIGPETEAEAKSQAVSTLIGTDYKTLSSNIRVINSHAELTRVLAGIPFTTFKGYASAFYYPVPINRPMGDVDFIVAPEYYPAAVERLEGAGWEKLGFDHERHESFRKNKIEFELHTEIKGIPNGADGIVSDSETAEEKVRTLLADLIETARAVQIQQGTVIIPDDFHHGLIMLLHVAGHMLNDGGVGLRHICDWAVYCHRVDVERFRQQLESVGLWTFACQLTALCSKYLGLPEMDWVGEQDDGFLEALMEDVLAAGNFGTKEAGRRTALEVKKTSFAEITKKRYPQASGIRLPLYMLINVFRYGRLLATGKRRAIKPSTFIGAKGRDELYSRFRLFEV